LEPSFEVNGENMVVAVQEFEKGNYLEYAVIGQHVVSSENP
jgi:hypothetical protein